MNKGRRTGIAAVLLPFAALVLALTSRTWYFEDPDAWLFVVLIVAAICIIAFLYRRERNGKKAQFALAIENDTAFWGGWVLPTAAAQGQSGPLTISDDCIRWHPSRTAIAAGYSELEFSKDRVLLVRTGKVKVGVRPSPGIRVNDASGEVFAGIVFLGAAGDLDSLLDEHGWPYSSD
jgi:hypothetical protein